MNRSTDLALRSLLPTHNGALPPQLADLAGSLLAQSRLRASTLKADEEIARAYACAHLACDRLKTSLNLPPIEPRPPIPPRLYKRLYTHLGTVLQPAPSSRNKTQPDRPARAGVAAPSTRVPGAITPSRTGRSNKAGQTKKASGTDADADTPWLRPTLRFVCNDLGYARLAPTVAAGLSAIQREAALAKGADGGGEKAGSAAWIAANRTALTAALCYYCVVSWRKSSGEGTKSGKGKRGDGQDALDKTYQADERAVLEAFERARTDIRLGKDTQDNRTAWEGAGWTELTRRGFREALMAVEAQQWLQSDWFRDIQSLQEQDEGGSDGDAADGDADDDGEGTILPTHVWRADSMFQARYDLLSEARRKDYAAWRDGILQQLDVAGAAGEAMDVRV